MGRVRQLRVQNFKSIGEEVALRFVPDIPLVLVGQNNAGKSNLMRALEIVLGESWPKSYKPEDHDFHQRKTENSPISITVEVRDVTHTHKYGVQTVIAFRLTCRPKDEPAFVMICEGGVENAYISNETREQCRSMLISADRRLSYQLGYSNKYTFLSKLMRQFYQALRGDAERMDQLKSRFDEIKGLFQGVADFKTFSDELQRQVGELSGSLEYELGVDFSAYDPSNYFHALRVLPHQGGQVRTFEELGTGQEQILALSFAYAYAKAFREREEGLVLIIEEPEAHLHPIAQEWVSRKIRELAKQGVQVVVTTHSPAFLDVFGLDGIALIRKKAEATEVVQLSKEELAKYCVGHGATDATADSILPFYAAAVTKQILSGFFAKKIVLVEGPTEALALPVYLEKAGLNTIKSGIAIIPVHGVGNLAKWWRLFTAYGIPVYVVFDNDKANEDSEGTRRSDLLAAMGISKGDAKEAMSATNFLVKQNYAVFGRNYEQIMREAVSPLYGELEGEARDRFGLSSGQSKPLIARYAADRISEELVAPIFKPLVDAIINLDAHADDPLAF